MYKTKLIYADEQLDFYKTFFNCTLLKEYYLLHDDLKRVDKIDSKDAYDKSEAKEISLKEFTELIKQGKKPLAPDWIKPGFIMIIHFKDNPWYIGLFSYLYKTGIFIENSYTENLYIAPIIYSQLGKCDDIIEQIWIKDLINNYDCYRIPGSFFKE